MIQRQDALGFPALRPLSVLRAVLRFVWSPPSLASLDRCTHSLDIPALRYWTVVTYFGLLSSLWSSKVRPILRRLPRGVGYRIVGVPALAFALLRGMRREAASEKGEACERLSGLSRKEQFRRGTHLLLRHPGLLPEECYTYGLLTSYLDDFVNNTASNCQTAFFLEMMGLDYHGALLVRDKVAFIEALQREGLPVSPVIAAFGTDAEPAAGEPVPLPARDLFVKPVYAARGTGTVVVAFDRVSGSYRFLTSPGTPADLLFPSEPLSGSDLLAALKEASRKMPLLLQPRLRSHPDLAALSGNDFTLMTVRVNSSKARGQDPVALNAILRIAVDATAADNISKGAIGAAIDLASGRIVRAQRRFEDRDIEQHPNSGKRLPGTPVPFVTDFLPACLRAHDLLASSIGGEFVPVVGWDIALTDSGWLFMEANCPSELTVSQTLHAPLWLNENFKASFASYIEGRARRTIHFDPILRIEQQAADGSRAN